MKRKDLIRIKSMLERDNYNVTDNFSKLLVNDLTKVLGEYFEFIIDPSFEIKKKGELIFINLVVKSESVKSFESLPKT
jgi:hypothetical protein